MRLIIRNDVNVLTVVPHITIAPHAGSTVSTPDGVFEILEVSFDYTDGTVNCQSDEFDISPTANEYNSRGDVI